MQLIRHLASFSDPRATAVAIGNFDGLHRGHRAVIDAMLQEAARQQLVPSVLTFEPHPRRYFAPDMPLFRLETLSQKLTRLRAWGVQRVYMPRFDAAFAAQSAEAFLQTVLQQQLRAAAVVTGENFAFGARRTGDVALLQTWGAAQAMVVHAIPPVAIAGEICSSSAVRAALAQGDMARVSALLGRHYALSGRVVHGAARGRQLGFPTANIALSPTLKLPAYGVYAVRASLPTLRHPGEGAPYVGVANLGMRPTVGMQERPSLEVHLFDFNADIYGAPMSVELIAHLRPEQTFTTLAALQAQIANDCQQAKQRVEVG